MSRHGGGVRKAGRRGRALVKPVGRAGRAAARGAAGRPGTMLIVLGVVVVLLVGGVGLLWQQTQRYEEVERSRAAALDVAAEHATALLSYDYRSAQEDMNQARKLLTGNFKNEYATLTTKTVTPAAKKQKVSTRAQVVASSVVSAEPDRVTVLLFLNQTTQSEALEAPKLSSSRIRMILEQVGDRWLVSALQPV